jgi:hypothetical protein
LGAGGGGGGGGFARANAPAVMTVRIVKDKRYASFFFIEVPPL